MVESAIAEKFATTKFAWSEFRDQKRVVVPAERLWDLLKFCCTELKFNQLTDLTAVDHLETPDATDRFEVVYFLLEVESGKRLQISTFINEPDLVLPTATNIWSGADWLERECYDMFGVVFKGHPNFKRLLLPQEFASFPLRKDYPQQGRGERHNFPVITRAEG